MSVVCLDVVICKKIHFCSFKDSAVALENQSTLLKCLADAETNEPCLK